MPNLKALTWTIPSRGVSSAEQGTGFGLPSSLHQLDIKILWDGEKQRIDLTWLRDRGWLGKLTSLRIDSANRAPEEYSEAATVECGDYLELDLPALGFLHCNARSLHGDIHAPQLKHVELHLTSQDDCHWDAFRKCAQLQRIDVRTEGAFDLSGCSFPDSLTDLSIRAARIYDYGCLSGPFPQLQRLHLECSFEVADVLDLRRLTGRSPADVMVDAGILTLWMPPKLDPRWR